MYLGPGEHRAAYEFAGTVARASNRSLGDQLPFSGFGASERTVSTARSDSASIEGHGLIFRRASGRALDRENEVQDTGVDGGSRRSHLQTRAGGELDTSVLRTGFEPPFWKNATDDTSISNGTRPRSRRRATPASGDLEG